MKNFKEKERERQTKLIQSGSPVFYGDEGGGWFMGRQGKQDRGFVLIERQNNLFEGIRNSAIKYFKENRIKWWGGKGHTPTGHVLSSQIACINYLFAIRNDKNTVLEMLNKITKKSFTEVLKIDCDKDPAYISFEVVSDVDHLNEKTSTRGSNCTSIDALILAKHQNGEIWLIPIEWKYTEHYGNTDKSIEDSSRQSANYKKGDEAKGKERLNRYCYNEKDRLIDNSNQLKSLLDYKNSVYFFEPFYQLMRQTLWAEQLILNKDEEPILKKYKEFVKEGNFLHIHVIPKENDKLLKLSEKKYKCSGKDMKQTWKNCLEDQSKYQIVDPTEIVDVIGQTNNYTSLAQYLIQRYNSQSTNK